MGMRSTGSMKRIFINLIQKKIFPAAVVLCLLAASFLAFPISAAFSPSIGIGNPGRVDQGATVGIAFSVNANETWVFQGSVSVAGGALVGVSFESANGATIATTSYHAANQPAGGQITVRVTSDSALTISISGTFGSVDHPSAGGTRSASVTIPVRSTAQRQAEEAAAAQAAAQAQAAAAAAAAAASRAAAEEASRQAAIEASVRAEQESIAAESASIAASESESASIEESIREESESIENSIAFESRVAAREESRRIYAEERSSLAVEATRAYEIDDAYYVPYGSKNWKKTQFLFAVENTLKTVPEGFQRAELIINEQKVEAFRSPDMDDPIYLVYGRRGERKLPDYYYNNADDESMISYKAVNGAAPGEILPAGETGPIGFGDRMFPADGSEAETVKPNRALLIFFGILSLLVVAALILLILVLYRRRSEKEERAAELQTLTELRQEIEAREERLNAAAKRENSARTADKKSGENAAGGVIVKTGTAGTRKEKRKHGR